MSEMMGKLRVGAIKKEITPSLPVDLVGYIRRFGKSTEIHDPLLANILLIDNGVEQALLISLDMLFLSSDFSLKVKQAVSEKLNIAKKNILIAAIHTHSAAGIHMFRDESLRDKNWEEKVFWTLIKGSAEAGQQLKTASLGVRMGRSTIGRNRRKEGGPVDSNFPVLLWE